MKSLPAADDLVRDLGLLPHPEGGYYRETYRAARTAGAGRAAATMIYFLVPAGRWFGAAPAAGTPYVLVGCTVSPAFEFDHFELGDRSALLARFPAAAELVTRLT